MADEKSETKEPEPPAKGKRKGLFLGGGMLALVAAGWAVSLVALPARSEARQFSGPWIVALSQEDVQVNLSGDGGKRFLVMTLQAEYDAYDQGYAVERVAEPLYQAKLKDAVIRVARKKTKEDLDDQVGEEVFKEEVRAAIEPLLFPVHVGNPDSPGEPDQESGLAPGLSAASSTLRSAFYEHVLRLDVPRGTIRLDEGPVIEFSGSETDLEVADDQGRSVFVDVSRLEPDFVGEVHTGTFGRVRGIYFGKLLVQ